MKRPGYLLLMAMVLLSVKTNAQDGVSQISYQNLAQQFSTTTINGDANTSILPSVAMENGFGSFIDNPASMALISTSYFNFGYLSNRSDNENSYLGNSSSIDNTQGEISNIGLVYRAPTEQGSFVLGGGYNATTTFNRTNLINGRNGSSTITDSFKGSGSDYNSIAFETYAIDYADVEQTMLESIFRIGFTPATFPGITQDAEISQTGSIGEFSLFTATEFQKNIFFGASLGLVSGTYKYRRDFRELDQFNDYDGDFIEQDSEGNGGTDINAIVLRDEIDSEIIGANIRAGLVFKVLPKLNIGASVLFPSKLIITEEYYSSLTTSFDDGRDNFFDDFDGEFNYSIRKPGQLNLGIAVDDLAGFSLSASTEIIDYRNTEVDLTRDSNLGFEEVIFLRNEQAIIDSTISADYNLVANLKGGMEYRVSNGIEFRIGGSFLPGKSSNFSADRFTLAGGVGVPLSQDLFLDITTQYTEWNDRSIMYEYFDTGSGDSMSESVGESISQLNVLIGIKYRF